MQGLLRICHKVAVVFVGFHSYDILFDLSCVGISAFWVVELNSLVGIVGGVFVFLIDCEHLQGLFGGEGILVCEDVFPDKSVYFIHEDRGNLKDTEVIVFSYCEGIHLGFGKDEGELCCFPFGEVGCRILFVGICFVGFCSDDETEGSDCDCVETNDCVSLY